MISLSTRTKEAIKTGLAMTIAYGIALSMDWEKPYWAGFAVAMISLATAGQSLNKAALRMLGTLVTTVVALILIALFAQDRWLFMLFLSAYVGICTYMMGGAKNKYFWHVCGFVCAIICMSAGPNSTRAFETAVLRVQETGLGILVYSLISVLIWPVTSRADFEAAAGKLLSTQKQLLRSYIDLVSGRRGAGEGRALRAQEAQEQTQFGQLLDAAQTDTYEVWEVRHQWGRYRGHAMELIETMNRWRVSFTEVKALDLSRLLPNLVAFGAELEERLAQIDRMLVNQAPERHPKAMDLDLDATEGRTLSHFQKAALAVNRSRLQHLELITRSMFDSLSDIKGFGQSVSKADTAPRPRNRFVPDPDRMMCAIRVISSMWLAYLGLIYINDFPGGAGFVSMAVPFAMAMATMPQLPVSLLFVPAAVSVLFAGLVHIFVMPLLSSFLGLGLLFFAVTFAICYIFATPRQALGRALGLAMFVRIASISNEQTYSFLSVANTALMFALLFLILIITAHVPFSFRPERAFLRLIGRFFRSCAYLMSTMRRNPQRDVTGLSRWMEAFHAREVSMLPRKLMVWVPHIDTKALSRTSPQLIQAVVTSMQGLSYRMQELLEERGNPQAQFLMQALQADVRAWRIGVQETFQSLAEDPAAGGREAFHNKLDKIKNRLEERIRVTLDTVAEKQFRVRDAENFYRMLGAYRGVSEALINYAGHAGTIDWAQWKEERF
ncbi:MAG: FUSC family protein [Deltaproteobacteria bacterium]|jgi:uncharacterized membrane protein YccC|nr:FUSC family protein [Deltaproteobacteria bacterium]